MYRDFIPNNDSYYAHNQAVKHIMWRKYSYHSSRNTNVKTNFGQVLILDRHFLLRIRSSKHLRYVNLVEKSLGAL